MRDQYMQFLSSFLRRHFEGKPEVVASENFGCFLGLLRKEIAIYRLYIAYIFKQGKRQLVMNNT